MPSGQVTQMDNYINEKIAISGAFNSAIKKMITKNRNMSKNESVDKISKLVNLALDANPLIGLKSMGPYIDRYYNEVSNGDINFFLNLDYDRIVKKVADSETDDDSIARKYIGDIVEVANVTKKNWAKFNDKEKNLIIKDFQEMLKFYNEFYLLQIRESLGGNANTKILDTVTYNPGTSRNAIFNIIEEKVVASIQDTRSPMTIVVKISSNDYCYESRLDNISPEDAVKAARIVKRELFEKLDKSMVNRVVLIGGTS